MYTLYYIRVGPELCLSVKNNNFTALNIRSTINIFPEILLWFVLYEKKTRLRKEKNTAPGDSLLITSVYNNNFVIVDQPSELYYTPLQVYGGKFHIKLN